MGRWLRIATTALAVTTAATAAGTLPAAQAADPAVQITFTTQPKVTFATGLTRDDGTKGAAVSVAFRVSRPATVTARALDASGAVVHTFATDEAAGLDHEVDWQFTDADDAALPEGDYTLRVEATDSDGGQDVESYPLPLDRHTVVPAQGVFSGTTYATNITMSVGPKPGVTLRSAEFVVGDGYGTDPCATSGSRTPGFGGRIQATFKVSDCGASSRDAGAVFEFTDRIGAQQTGYTAPIPIRVADRVAPAPALAPSSTSSDTLSLRDPDRYETSGTTYYVREAGSIATATYEVLNAIGARVATGTLVAEGAAPTDDSHTWQYALRWAGTRNDGTRLPAGRYRVATKFTDAAGLSAAGPAVTLVLDPTIPGTLATTRIDGYQWQVVVTPKTGAGVTGVTVSTSPADADPATGNLLPLTYDAGTGTYRTVLSLAGRPDGSYPLRALITRGTGAAATTFTTADQELVVLPDETAPAVTLPTNSRLYLGLPGQYTAGTFTFSVSDQSGVRSSDFVVNDTAGNVVDHVVAEGGEGRTSFTWDGTGPDGEPLPGGDYVVSTTFTDEHGNEAPASAPVHLDDTVPATLAVVGRTGNLLTVEVTPTPGVKVHAAGVAVIGSSCCNKALELDPATGRFRATVDLDGRPTGTYYLTSLVVRDTPGAAEPYGYVWSAPIPVTVSH
ncbi:FlgD immunoglobulin-like domain containing protein [Nocardioides sp. SLBN-35]|uniref:FlgD immunoglobulin-like domain containing protein n=1 Tax=Nocardioides sp. SLBN-35 TaxID=2768445 RepID=UPI001150EA4B|nr:FlgD immunoglobulin-like domain containing protein [Nocardioides sp. SLBN-35]TQK69542.1 FlgD-like protein [Nocardioides sp. SLBN-35]